MVVFPNAKINLGLNIISKRDDGYHNIETCFYPVNWSDVLEIIESNDFSFTSSGITIPGDESTNLCIRAYQLLKQDFNIPPVKIHLHKIIPIGAGLGGGSSDAAFTLKLLNEKFSLSMDIPGMQNYARKLGSDCAFFINNKPSFASGRGDDLMEIDLKLNLFYGVVIYPHIHVSTVQAYNGTKPTGSVELADNIRKPVSEWKDKIYNDFESSVFAQFPQIEALKSDLYRNGAVYACMSGSGSAVIGIFERKPVLDLKMQEGFLCWEGYL